MSLHVYSSIQAYDSGLSAATACVAVRCVLCYENGVVLRATWSNAGLQERSDASGCMSACGLEALSYLAVSLQPSCSLLSCNKPAHLRLASAAT